MMHPGFVLFLTAVIVPLVRGTARRVVLAAGTVAALISWESLDFTSGWRVTVAGYSLTLLHVDPLSLVFSLIFTLVTFVGILYALHNNRAGEHVSTLVYAGSSLGVVLAGDWATLFVFWELMAVSSLFLIWQSGTERSARAGYRYLLVHIFGGSLLFAGILVHLARGGGFAVSALTTSETDPLAFWLILLGVAINAAIPPLHAWLTDAYPEASVTGSVFLSAFTTKTAVYVLLRLFPGADVLVWAGVAMALYGVVYAVLENDIRRLLAYHIVSQVGYMVAGVGMGTSLALDGATAHAFSHILYKSLLFMGMGAVIYATGLRKLTELGGIANRMKLVVVLYAVGACSISGFPLFNGFISKSMIVSAAAEAHLPVVELLLTLASVGTFLHTGLKLPYFTFFGPKKDLELRPLPLEHARCDGRRSCSLHTLRRPLRSSLRASSFRRRIPSLYARPRRVGVSASGRNRHRVLAPSGKTRGRSNRQRRHGLVLSKTFQSAHRAARRRDPCSRAIGFRGRTHLHRLRLGIQSSPDRSAQPS